MLWDRIQGWMLAEYDPGTLRLLTQYKPETGTIMTRKMLREEYSGRQSRCFLGSILLFCQKKELLIWSKCGCCMKAEICSPASKPGAVQGALLPERYELCVCYWTAFLSLTWVSLISGHQLTGPSVNQSTEMITAAMLRSCTLRQFIPMTAGNETVAHSLQWKIHFLTSKQRSTSPQNSKVVLLRILLLFVQFL